MIKGFFIGLIFCLPGFIQGQNLVMNPSFEDTVSLFPSSYYQLCENWVNPTYSTSDYFSPHAIALGWGPGTTAPISGLGVQKAQHGVAYIGLVTWEPNLHQTKDYAEGELIQPLVKDRLYCVSLYVNLADSSNYTNCDLEISFSQSQIRTTSLTPLMLTDSVKFNLSDVDTVSWVLKTGLYKAIGGERFLYVGSTVSNTDLSCVQNGPNFSGSVPQAAYYFVDNVSVIDCTEELLNFEFPNIFTPNEDGVNDFISFEILQELDFNFKLYNRWGNQIYINSDHLAKWNGKDNNGNALSDGVYYYTLSFFLGDNFYLKNGFIHIKN